MFQELVTELTREFHDIRVILIRLFVAFVAGAIMGLEREKNLAVRRRTGAGFRTYSLVCLGSCMYALVSRYGFMSEGQTVDPGRVAAQVVAGVGFLGAGTILKDQSGNYIRGLTTAAGLWVAAAIGLFIGAGMYVTGLIASALTFVILDAYRLLSGLTGKTRARKRRKEQT